ncbi:MAG: hypothetical protein GF335_00240 [Candidatus Moranbacteria bacterium]|nr:hypothetical protein [Candidatus Moranbacteria bacterium]
MNEEPRNNENEDWLSDTKEWFAENVRIVLAIIIVLIIAVGIYFYSNRATEDIQVAQNQDEQTDQEQADMEEGDLIEEDQQGTQAQEEEEPVMEEEAMEEEEMTEENVAQEQMQEDQMQEDQMQEEITEEEPQEQTHQQEETTDQTQEEETQVEDKEVTQQGDAYQVSASAGDSVTTLARVALSQYLQQNPKEGLTAEHKIYIEDYLARRAGYNSSIEVGATRSFSSNEIQSAIDASRNLSDQVLEHLKIYSQKVPNL